MANSRMGSSSWTLASVVPIGVLGAVLATSCVGDAPSVPGISGSIGVSGNTAGATLAPGSREFEPGEVIVRFRSETPSKRARFEIGDSELSIVRNIALPGTALYRAPGASAGETLAMVRELEKDPDVLYAQPNYRVYMARTPNDNLFNLQWHYPAINLPQAWDITIGSASTVVAVVDTGAIFDANQPNLSHPDLTGKMLPGFDFISSVQVSGDGNGRDNNPFDPNDSASYHGSHVAGTMAARTDDGVGVAGVDWQAKIVPVRVLGGAGGSLTDVYEGLMWAAGLPINGVPNNANPAQVINMSLGGPGQCSAFEQDSINKALARGAIIVVAAGNDNANASQFAPSSCAGVITVGATDGVGARAPYSNFGSRIDVMAPGGNTGADLTAPIGEPDGVLSISKNDANGQFIARYLNGTSMASPHVAGVVSLMKAVKPDLTAKDALAILRATARPLSAAKCNRPAATDCGAGLIDAAAAVNAAKGGAVPGIGVTFAPEPADLGLAATSAQFTLTNTTAAAVTWSFTTVAEAIDNPLAAPAGKNPVTPVAGQPTSGSITAGGTASISFNVDRSYATADGTYTFTLNFTVGGQARPVTLRFAKLSGEIGLPKGPMIVGALTESTPGMYDVAASQVSDTFLTAYHLDVGAGQFTVVAWSDDNNNQTIDTGDFIGIYPTVVSVAAGQAVTKIDFSVGFMLGGTSLGSGPIPLDQLSKLLAH